MASVNKKYLWKFLNNKDKDGVIVSAHDSSPWVIGEWRTTTAKPVCCKVGFHGSEEIYQAFTYVHGSVLATVEVKGKHADDKDKSAYQQMRIIKAWKWDKTASVKLAIFAAELVIDIYEKQYPTDDRPRKAIEAAKKWLVKPSKRTADAAEAAANAAYAANAANAAYAAAEAAAYAAAEAAAYAAAEAAAYAAAEAAKATAYADLIQKINTYMVKLAKDLKEWP